MDILQQKDIAFVRLDKGEDLFESLISLANKYQWPGAHISGIGAVKDVELGFFDERIKDYHRKTFANTAELLSLEGNLSFLDNKPFYHLHVVLGDENYQVYGGHLFKATVAVTVEINVRLLSKATHRLHHEAIGFKQLQMCPGHKI